MSRLCLKKIKKSLLKAKWVIFSIGNPVEGYGDALPRNIDDLHSQRIAHLISCRTGARYVGHLPWATDNFTSVAKDWAPKSIPVKELVKNIIDFIKFHTEIYKKMDLPASRILIYSGHGGNNPLVNYTEEIKNDLNLEKLIVSTTEGIADDNMDRILQ
jgi:creatinine amidohydrolase/Fe(II)-dependent formamide hydrolase-like protein